MKADHTAVVAHAVARFTLHLACFLIFSMQAMPSLALGTGKPLREYGQQSWQSDSGLPENTVRAILQTRDGYLWIGTEAGLVRFDGVDFAVFDRSNTLAMQSEFISSLKEDADGSLWVGTASGLVRERGGIFASTPGSTTAAVFSLCLTQKGRLFALTSAGAEVLDQGRLKQIAGTERLGLTEAASLAEEDAQGRLWIAGSEGITFVAQGATQLSATIETIDAGQIQSLALSASGELWAGGSSGLKTLSSDRALRTLRLSGLPSNDVTQMLAGTDGSMWIGTSKGLALYRNGMMKVVADFAGMRVQNLFLDRATTLWVATSGGTARITEGKVDWLQHSMGSVLSVLEDREGSMWFGTETAGLHVLRDQAFSTLSKEDGLSADLVRAVFEDHAGTLWIGTSGGGLDQLSGGRASHFAGRLPSNVILALAETSHDGSYDLWVGMPEGLAQVHGSAIKVFTTADGLTDDFVRSLYAERDGSLWIGTRNGLSHWKDGKFHSYSRLDGLPSDLVGTMLRGQAGVLWVGTLGGLSRMEGETFVPVRGLPEGAITALLEDHAGTLWAGVNNQGLLRLGSRGVTAFSGSPAVPGLPATIYGMLEDASGDLWLSSRKGVDRVSIARLEAYTEKSAGSLPVTHYGSADGMRISEASGGGHPAAWQARDGGLWFATLDGVSVVHPRAGLRNPVPPLAAIEQVSIEDQVVAPTSQSAAIRVGAGHGRLSIKYAGLSFVAPQGLRYQYMLEGFDRGWVKAEGRRTAFYTNVPPGSYRFLVRCMTGDGIWSIAPASQRFKVEPFLYQTAWFYALAGLGLAGLGYLAYQWRVLTVEAQYRAVMEERNRIAREIHDTLAQGYVAIAVQLELAERLVTSSTEAAAAQIRQTKAMVREGLEEARSSIWNLRAQSEAETLPSLVASYVTSIARRHEAETSIKFTVHGTYRPLERSVEKEVERIAQQAIANAVAHGRASLITASLSYHAQHMELIVADNGVGMKAVEEGGPGGGHFGLQGMRERAARIGAQLAIESAPQLGVVVRLRIELQRAGKEDAL